MGVVRRSIKSMFQKHNWKILRGDKVQILAGKDKGQQGIVRKVIRDVKVPRVLVEGRNLSKRHIKRSDKSPGGIITTESPLHYSNVCVVDPTTNKPVRVSFRWQPDGTKLRFSAGKNATRTEIPRPEILKQRTPRALPGPKDTDAEDAAKRTVEDGDLPTALEFKKGIFSFKQKAPASVPKGTRAFSSGATFSSSNGGSGISLPMQLSLLAARRPCPSWQGFAATSLLRN